MDIEEKVDILTDTIKFILGDLRTLYEETLEDHVELWNEDYKEKFFKELDERIEQIEKLVA